MLSCNAPRFPDGVFVTDNVVYKEALSELDVSHNDVEMGGVDDMMVDDPELDRLLAAIGEQELRGGGGVGVELNVDELQRQEHPDMAIIEELMRDPDLFDDSEL